MILVRYSETCTVLLFCYSIHLVGYFLYAAVPRQDIFQSSAQDFACRYPDFERETISENSDRQG